MIRRHSHLTLWQNKACSCNLARVLSPRAALKKQKPSKILCIDMCACVCIWVLCREINVFMHIWPCVYGMYCIYIFPMRHEHVQALKPIFPGDKKKMSSLMLYVNLAQKLGSVRLDQTFGHWWIGLCKCIVVCTFIFKCICVFIFFLHVSVSLPRCCCGEVIRQ